MSNFDHLKSVIYHEKQESGSMLCAQHALNSLLQGNYFTPPDLSEIAQNLDDLENSYHDGALEAGSRNMDDTGFFSLQVLEHALSVWGLSLVRWRSEQMRPFQDHPHTQQAFVLNLEQHWFTLRRFGPAESDMVLDSGDGQWFNLNSFLDAPQWVSKTYLGMVLQQAETEGYSVFAVTRTDPDGTLGLPRTRADELATFPEPDYADPPDVHATLSRSLESQHASSSHPHSMEYVEGIEDEDYELQAALQASLMAESHGTPLSSDSPPSAPPRLMRAPIPLPSDNDAPSISQLHSSSQQTPILSNATPSGRISLPGHADVDPVEASRERNLVLLRRMREQQELAQREMFDDPEDAAAFERRREERRRQEEQEEEDLRRAIAESEALVRERSKSTSQSRGEDESSEMTNAWNGEPSGVSGARVYDDEDAELQAALKASLESVPEGYQHPPSPRPNPVLQSTAPRTSGETGLADDAHETESVLSDSTATEGPSELVTSEEPSIDEIRRARLARFGM